MEDDLMFSMEEEEEQGSAKRPAVHCRGASQRTSSLSESNASEDDEEDHFIVPILDDSAREICHYLKDLVNTRQLSNSLPRSSFTYRVSRCHSTWVSSSHASAKMVSCLSTVLFLKNRK